MGIQVISDSGSLNDSRVVEPISREAQVDQEGLTPYTRELAEKKYNDTNIRSLIVNLADNVEKIHMGKIKPVQHELEQQHKKIENLMKFAELLHEKTKYIEENNNDPRGQEIQLQDKSDIVRQAYEITEHKYIKDGNTKLTYEQAKELIIFLTRHDDKLKQQVQLTSLKLSHLFEDWFQILPILKEMMKEMNEHIKGIIQKSVSR